MIPQDFQKYIRSKEFKEMLAKYRQCMDNGESCYLDADDLLDIAEYYHIRHDSDAAIEAASHCVSLFPDNDKGKVFIARTYILDNDYEKARKVAKSIPSDSNLDVVYLRAELMLYDKEYDKVECYLMDVFDDVRKGNIYVEYDEDEDVNSCAEYALDVTLLYCDYMQWDIADAWLLKSKAEGIDTQSADYIEANARICTALGRIDEAIELWNSYIDMDAYSYMAWMQLAQCHYQKGNCAEALQSAQYAESINPASPEVYMSEGNCLFALGRIEESLQKYQRFVEMAPDDVQGELLMASTLFALERYEEASVHILLAIKGIEENNGDSEPQFSETMCKEVYRQAAYILSTLGRLDEALACADKLLLYGVSKSRVDLLHAGVMLEYGKVVEGFEILDRAIRESGYDPDVCIQVGCLLVDATLYEAGYNMLSQTLQILTESKSDVTVGFDRLAYSALATDHYDEFLAALKKSCVHLPFETAALLSSFFPDDMPVNEYVAYAEVNQIKFK